MSSSTKLVIVPAPPWKPPVLRLPGQMYRMLDPMLAISVWTCA